MCSNAKKANVIVYMIHAETLNSGFYGVKSNMLLLGCSLYMEVQGCSTVMYAIHEKDG